MSVRNITKCFRLASESDVSDGMNWYSGAMALARSLDPVNPVQAAGVIAVLSPMTSWPVNVRLAIGVYNGETPKCLAKNSAKAMAIFNGADANDIVSGPKVRSFFANIVGLDNDEAVTIDRHAIDICAGRVQNDADRSKAISGKGKYAGLVAEYTKAAKILSKETGTKISASQVQAVTWTYWRRAVIAKFYGDI